MFIEKEMTKEAVILNHEAVPKQGLRYPTDFLNKIICGDSLELIKIIPNREIDCILTDPLKSFKNSSDIYGKSSVSGDELVYIINKANVLNLVYMMKVFGMASKRHNHDVIEILKILIEIIG